MWDWLYRLPSYMTMFLSGFITHILIRDWHFMSLNGQILLITVACVSIGVSIWTARW